MSLKPESLDSNFMITEINAQFRRWQDEGHQFHGYERDYAVAYLGWLLGWEGEPDEMWGTWKWLRINHPAVIEIFNTPHAFTLIKVLIARKKSHDPHTTS